MTVSKVSKKARRDRLVTAFMTEKGSNKTASA